MARKSDSPAEVASSEQSAGQTSWVSILGSHIRQDPKLWVALAYGWLTAVGFARLFGSGMAFGINAIDLAAPSDFFLAGLRDPLVIVAAFVTGIALAWLWQALESWNLGGVLFAVVVAAILLVACVMSSKYRDAVVRGAWADCNFAPLPMTVTYSGEKEKTETDLKLVVATSKFIVFHQDAVTEETDKHTPSREVDKNGNTIVLKREAIQLMRFTQRDDQSSL